MESKTRFMVMLVAVGSMMVMSVPVTQDARADDAAEVNDVFLVTNTVSGRHCIPLSFPKALGWMCAEASAWREGSGTGGQAVASTDFGWGGTPVHLVATVNGIPVNKNGADGDCSSTGYCTATRSSGAAHMTVTAKACVLTPDLEDLDMMSCTATATASASQA